jgi:hypothetical protein
VSEALSPSPRPTLAGWIIRDVLITSGLAAMLLGLAAWHEAEGSLAAALVAPALGFVAAYVLCYVYHEWGHLIGARLTGAAMPLAPYAGALIGHFDIQAHSRRQFLWLSWGGVIAYVALMSIALSVYLHGGLGPAGAGFAVGGLAFVVQSLSVDVPQIVRVMRGDDIARTSAEGANARVILRRTWQSWLVLAGALIVWNFAS